MVTDQRADPSVAHEVVPMADAHAPVVQHTAKAIAEAGDISSWLNYIMYWFHFLSVFRHLFMWPFAWCFIHFENDLYLDVSSWFMIFPVCFRSPFEHSRSRSHSRSRGRGSADDAHESDENWDQHLSISQLEQHIYFFLLLSSKFYLC